MTRARELMNLASYDQGRFAPVHDERDAPDLEVLGELPAALKGVFAQNGANPAFPPQEPYHWFDGDGMVHAVAFADGRASYRNRYVQTAALAEDRAAGRALRAGIMRPFTPGDPAPDKDTANTDLVAWDGGLLALWWLGGEPYRLRLPDLATVGVERFGGTRQGSVAAHAKVDPRTNELLFFDYNPYRPPYLQVGAALPDRELWRRDIELPHPSLLHDIAFTERYVVLLDFPLFWDPARLAEGKRRVRFERAWPARLGLLPRDGRGEVRWFEVPSCYAYHTVNAWEETTPEGGRRVVVTACRIEDPIPRSPHAQDADVPRLEFLRLDPVAYRWTLDLDQGTARGEALHDERSEFPRADDRFLGLPTRHAWHPLVARSPTLLFSGLRHDDAEGAGSAWRYPEGWTSGEAVFAPRPGAPEGDGWVLTLATDGERSELWVLPALDLSRGPMARVLLPRRVPVGFHAAFAA
jgi:carotenoid cleavage dioxygenase